MNKIIYIVLGIIWTFLLGIICLIWLNIIIIPFFISQDNPTITTTTTTVVEEKNSNGTNLISDNELDLKLDEKEVSENIKCEEYNDGVVVSNCTVKELMVKYSELSKYTDYMEKDYDDFVKKTIYDNYTNSAINILLIKDDIVNPLKEEGKVTLFWIEDNWHIHLNLDNARELEKHKVVYPVFAKIDNLENLMFYQDLKRTNL